MTIIGKNINFNRNYRIEKNVEIVKILHFVCSRNFYWFFLGASLKPFSEEVTSI